MAQSIVVLLLSTAVFWTCLVLADDTGVTTRYW